MNISRRQEISVFDLLMSLLRLDNHVVYKRLKVCYIYSETGLIAEAGLMIMTLMNQ